MDKLKVCILAVMDPAINLKSLNHCRTLHGLSERLLILAPEAAAKVPLIASKKIWETYI